MFFGSQKDGDIDRVHLWQLNTRDGIMTRCPIAPAIGSDALRLCLLLETALRYPDQCQPVVLPGGTPGVTDVLFVGNTPQDAAEDKALCLGFGQHVHVVDCSLSFGMGQMSMESDSLFTNVRFCVSKEIPAKPEIRRDFFAAPNVIKSRFRHIHGPWTMLNPDPNSCTSPLFCVNIVQHERLWRIVVWDVAVHRKDATVRVSLRAPLSVVFVCGVEQDKLEIEPFRVFAAMGSIWLLCVGDQSEGNSKGTHLCYSVYRFELGRKPAKEDLFASACPYTRRKAIATHGENVTAADEVESVQGRYWHWKLMAAGDRIPCAGAFANLQMHIISPAGRANRLVFMGARSQFGKGLQPEMWTLDLGTFVWNAFLNTSQGAQTMVFAEPGRHSLTSIRSAVTRSAAGWNWGKAHGWNVNRGHGKSRKKRSLNFHDPSAGIHLIDCSPKWSRRKSWLKRRLLYRQGRASLAVVAIHRLFRPDDTKVQLRGLASELSHILHCVFTMGQMDFAKLMCFF